MADDAGGSTPAKLFSARESSVMVDGTAIPGLQSLEYKYEKNIINVNSVGSDTKTGVDYGPKVITGKIRVKSAFDKLDSKFYETEPEKAKFQLIANLKHAGSANTRSVQFQDCHMIDRDFSIEVNGVGECVYTFTATDIKNDGAGGAT